MKESELISFWINDWNKRFPISNIYEDIKDLDGIPHKSQKVIPINCADHYSVFRDIESPKESTGYSNYDGKEF